MTPEPGQLLLHYRLVDKLGEGGMGVVWRAVDTTLDREVAIKFLPEGFGADSARLSRFEREAKLLASLNHPNVAAIYGFHADGPSRFLAMEYVPGEDLAQRLARGPLPVDEAIATARQVAEALEAAHERGVIHRDLKPANVKVSPGGEVKVLDFGLAKALDPATESGPADLAHSPTVTSAGTLAGMILGTAAYMSPEQARGKPLDRRTDLWSFGCVLYEMLTGRPAFSGETVTDVLSAVISTEPDRERLPDGTPPSLRRLVDRCLVKDARGRQADAATARLDLDDAKRELTEPRAVHAPTSRTTARSWWPWAIAVVALVLALQAWFGRSVPSGDATPGAPSVTGIEALTDSRQPEFMPALSPDGKNLAYVAHDGDDRDIFLLRVGGENAINLTAGRRGDDLAPAFSPDGDRIAFASTGADAGLFVMGATGESPRRVADEGTHPSWSPDGKRLVAATEQVDNPYARVSRSQVFVVDLETSETRDLPVGADGVGPRWSPDGKRIAYWSEIDGQRDLWTLAVDGGEPVKLTDDVHCDWEPVWAEGGRAIVFHSDRGGSPDLWRLAIDPGTGGAVGEPTPLTIGVTPVWESSLSADGTRLVGAMRKTSGALAAYPFDPVRGAVTGKRRVLFETGSPLRQPKVSRDGRRLVYRTTSPKEQITTYDLATGSRKRLTDDAFRNRGPLFSPDGDWIVFYSNRGGPYQLWMMRSEGTDLHRVYSRSASDPSWSPDGERIALAVDRDTERWVGTAILQRDPDAGSERAEWIEAIEPIDDFSALLWSPDGRYLAGTIGYPQVWKAYDLERGRFLDNGEPLQDFGSEYYATWLPDGKRVLLWDEQTRLVVWNVETGERVPVGGSVETIGSPLLSPDGRTLYIAEEPVEGEIWMLTLE